MCSSITHYITRRSSTSLARGPDAQPVRMAETGGRAAAAHQVLADTLRAGVPGLDGYGAVAAGTTIGAMVAGMLHAMEHGGSVDEVRAP